MNQDLVKLNRFDGNNYARWKDKMMFLLTALRISYILDPELWPPPEEPRTSAEGVPPDAEEFERDYRKKLLHKSEDFTLEQFQKHLHIEEESSKRENKVTVPVESNVHYVDESGSQSKNLALQVRKNDEQFKKKANQDGEQKKKKGSCYVCGKKGDINNNVINKYPIMLNLENDPRSFSEAMSSRDASFWKEAIDDEMDSMFVVGKSPFHVPNAGRPLSSNLKWKCESATLQSLTKQIEQKEGQYEVEESHENEVEPMRSKIMRIAKTYGSDFYMYLVEGTRMTIYNSIPIVLNMESDPRTYEKAMKSQDASFYKKAIIEEIDSIMRNGTRKFVDLPLDSKPICCKWIFKKKKKLRVDGSIEKFKARLVAKGFSEKEGIDYFDTYAPVARIGTIRVLITLVSIHKLIIHQIDVKTKLLNGELDEEVYMQQSEGFVIRGQENKLGYAKHLEMLMMHNM
ncbi:hypothetical protein RJ639_018027 [Escallonia herrerae]|uniref:Reverse transcriptase Ty1/copia-type domain-containing protein n=1 Tax=Escallonia herrerae TaxID=1293975 RepID=A0AA88V9F2_9ASTE|nr:hypothetical protein RJ639_018027 [Escallonia herrerae]